MVIDNLISNEQFSQHKKKQEEQRKVIEWEDEKHQKGLDMYRETYEEIIETITQPEVDIKSLQLLLLKYRLQKEDGPIWYEIEMPHEYDKEINQTLRKRGILMFV